MIQTIIYNLEISSRWDKVFTSTPRIPVPAETVGMGSFSITYILIGLLIGLLIWWAFLVK